MDLYDLLLFLHISAAVIWIGSGFLINVLAFRANKNDDTEGLRRILGDVDALAKTVFIPASLAVFVLGVLMVIDQDAWKFDQLWIVLGLIGYFATFVTGLAVLTPRAERTGAQLSQEGMTPAVIAQIRELLVLARLDLVVLFLVISDMAIKPTGDDVGVLIGMAAVLVIATLVILNQARTTRIGGEAPAAAQA